MKKREDIVQKFSTFLSFGDRNIGRQAVWQADSQLERQIKRLIQPDPEAKEEFWAKYFLKILREVSQLEINANVGNLSIPVVNYTAEVMQSSGVGICDRTALAVTNSQTLQISPLITARHLSAYLQEACLWAAQRSYHKYHFLRHKYAIEDYFQIASSFANSPAKLLKSFALEYPRSNIEAYAKTVIFRLIRDKLYQQDLEAKRGKFSDYGLLKDLNVKELKEALTSQGITQRKIDLYRLVWQSFNEIYQPQKEFGRSNLQPPNQEDLKQIVNYYNHQLNQLNLVIPVANEDEVKEMLEICIKAARNYRTKHFIPLEERDNISDIAHTPWEIIVQEEERQQVQLLVCKLFAAIPKTGQIMLILWQGLNLTQSEIATVIKSKYPELQKQYQVARHLARYTKNILKDFVTEWNLVNPGNAIDNEQDLAKIKEALDECLQLHCKELVNSILERVSEEIDTAEKSLLFNQKLALNQLTTTETPQRVLNAKQALTKAFISKLEIEFSLSVDAILPIFDKLTIFIEEWLTYAKYQAL